MLLNSLQQDLLVLVCLDDERAPIIRGVVELNLFTGPNRIVANAAYGHLDRFKRAPGQHLRNILSDKLEGDNRNEIEIYTEIVDQIYLSQNTIDATFVMSQLETFIRRQAMHSMAKELFTVLQKDTEAALDEAHQIISRSHANSMSLFDPGIRLSDRRRALAFLDIPDTALPTGISEFDKRGFGPTRKELWLLVANTKKGKSWGLIHLAKMALMHHARVIHITLEMSAERVAQRYFQTFWVMGKRKDPLPITRLRKTEDKLTGLEYKQLTPKLGMDEPDIRKKLEVKIKHWEYRVLDNIYVKAYPTGQLTVPMLKAYLDNMKSQYQFEPDLLVVDYPDLFKMPIKDLRLQIGNVYKDLRGLLVERNIAGAIVSQANRAAVKSKRVGIDNVAEDISKIAHADTVVLYSQTPAEQKRGLARLTVGAGRNDQDQITVVITQQYGVGNFVVDSHMMTGGYFDLLPEGEDDV